MHHGNSLGKAHAIGLLEEKEKKQSRVWLAEKNDGQKVLAVKKFILEAEKRKDEFVGRKSKRGGGL